MPPISDSQHDKHHSDTSWTATTRFHGLFDPKLMADEVLRRLTPQFEVAVDDS